METLQIQMVALFTLLIQCWYNLLSFLDPNMNPKECHFVTLTAFPTKPTTMKKSYKVILDSISDHVELQKIIHKCIMITKRITDKCLNSCDFFCC